MGKESQKDLLFSKLLPAINENPFSTTYQGKAKKEDFYIPFDEDSDDQLSALRSRLFARESNYNHNTYVTVNIMESVVLKNLDHVITRFNACSCDRCKCDIAASALTTLQAKYIVAEPKKITKLEEDISAKEVMSALVNAVIKVRANPRH